MTIQYLQNLVSPFFDASEIVNYRPRYIGNGKVARWTGFTDQRRFLFRVFFHDCPKKTDFALPRLHLLGKTIYATILVLSGNNFSPRSILLFYLFAREKQRFDERECRTYFFGKLWNVKFIEGTNGKMWENKRSEETFYLGRKD